MTPEEFADASKKKEGRQYAPGNYDMRIIDAVFVKRSEKDDTWLQYRVILSVDGEKVVTEQKDGKDTIKVLNKKGQETKYIQHTLMVPTKKETFPGNNPTFLFSKLKDFFLGMGIVLDNRKETMKAIIPKYFLKPEVLKGTLFNVTVGYNGAHTVREGDVFKLVNAKGNPMTDQTFATFDDVKAYCAVQEKPIKLAFIEIQKFNEPTVSAAEAEDEIPNPFDELDIPL
jgi:hypothetical protein